MVWDEQTICFYVLLPQWFKSPASTYTGLFWLTYLNLSTGINTCETVWELMENTLWHGSKLFSAYFLENSVTLFYMGNVIWTTFSCDNLLDNQIIQRNLGSGTKIKGMERESRRTMWVRERKLLQKLLKNGGSNIISHFIFCYTNCL